LRINITTPMQVPVEIGDGRFVDIIYAAETVVRTDDGEVKITADIEVDQHGRGHCVGLEVRPQASGQSITTDTLRQLPLGRLVRQATIANQSSQVGPPRKIPAGPGRSAQVVVDHGPVGQPFSHEIAARRQQSRGNIIPITEVGEVYRRSMESPGRKTPNKDLQEHFRISQRTASKWTRAARDRGFLGEAKHGKANV